MFPAQCTGRFRDIRRLPALTHADRPAPLPIDSLLVPVAFVRPVVFFAPLVGLLTAMVLTATKRTAEVSPMGVSRMRQKTDPTMETVNRAACQTRMIAQDSIHCHLILTKKRVGAVVLVPIRTK
jgi:hypothetical protein